MDPVTLGLCSQIDLDMEVDKAARNRPFQTEEEQGATLESARETERAADNDDFKEIDADAVFVQAQVAVGKPFNEDDDQY